MSEATVPLVAVLPDLEESRLYLNRELSLLAFQWRVLAEARDESNPLLERVKFLAIVASNVEEFFMVRVGGLLHQKAARVEELSPDGMSPQAQLGTIRIEAERLLSDVQSCFATELLPALAKSGIHILDYADLSAAEKAEADRTFDQHVFPVLTPLAHDPGRPFPHISNLSLNLGITVRDARGRERFARLKVPSTLPRLVPVKTTATVPGEHRLVWLEQLISAKLAKLFPGMTVVDAHPFHVTRDADLDIREVEADDLLETIEESVRRRRFHGVVRLAVREGMPAAMRETLESNLEITPAEVYALSGPLALGSLMALRSLDRPDLKDVSFQPARPRPLRRNAGEGGIFAAIRQGDILLHHPYDSFNPVIEFVARAARDPEVLAIKQSLYRVGTNSPVVEALLEAPRHGKEVAALVELKARFDEESNIEWARALEAEGVHVIYGLVGLKTHAKVALVVRKEGDRIRRYVHLATGNYNAVSAQHYTDIGMFTTDEAIGADASDLFNLLTGYSAKRDFRKLLVAPINLRSRMEELIRREIDHQKKGEPGHLIFKMNALVDRRMIRLLYEASRAGVRVDLIVRGICCLRPGLEGVSDNIRVVSIVGRFLEHSRIFYFRNGGKEEVYAGSADLMPRNLDHRVEVVFPIEDPALVRQVRHDILATELRDNVKARRMLPDGTYEQIHPGPDEQPVNSQQLSLPRRGASEADAVEIETGADGAPLAPGPRSPRRRRRA